MDEEDEGREEGRGRKRREEEGNADSKGSSDLPLIQPSTAILPERGPPKLPALVRHHSEKSADFLGCGPPRKVEDWGE